MRSFCNLYDVYEYEELLNIGKLSTEHYILALGHLSNAGHPLREPLS
jgi:hypothetical protein